MSYKELYESWRKENRSYDLLKLPTDYFLTWEAAITKHVVKIENSIKTPLPGEIAKITCERMNYLLNDMKTVRKLKILEIKLNNNYIDSSLLTEEEKKFYRAFSILEEEIYGIQAGKAYKREKKSIEQVSPASGVAEGTPVGSSSNLVIGILSDTPEFEGIDKRTHGSFRKGDVATLPAIHALSLVRKGVAFLIETKQD
ncbi:MAG: hypothetical protein ACXAEU_20320 [Candidatus Hodarchaeales archaeon]|jgi:DNA replication initiation complex subunit (GINS family)